MKYLIAIAFTVFASAAWAQSYTISGFSMAIKGGSNLHDWEEYAKEVRVNGQIVVDNSGLKEIKSLYVEVPVKSIKSSKGSIMDSKTYDALKADVHRNITFKLDKATVSRKSDYYDVNANGNLSIAGATKLVPIYVKGKVNGDMVTFTGSKKLKMTDFGIKPPTALMGTMTVADDVELVFQVSMKKS